MRMVKDVDPPRTGNTWVPPPSLNHWHVARCHSPLFLSTEIWPRYPAASASQPGTRVCPTALEKRGKNRVRIMIQNHLYILMTLGFFLHLVRG